MTTLPEIAPRQTLHDILNALKDHERLVETMTDPSLVPDATTLIEDLKDKIDNIYKFRCALDHAADAMDARLKQLKEARDKVESNRKRVDALLIWNMQNSQSEVLPGNEVRARLQYTQVCEPLSPSPQLADCALWPQFVRTKLEWDKTAIKESWKKGSDVGAVANVQKNAHIRFMPTTKILEGGK